MEKPILSPDFTMDDIHKIREWNYERRKNMTFEKYKADVQEGANKVLERIEQLRKEKELSAN